MLIFFSKRKCKKNTHTKKDKLLARKPGKREGSND
jgi:hypothetical protein